jgi:hypothetical protein
VHIADQPAAAAAFMCEVLQLSAAPVDTKLPTHLLAIVPRAGLADNRADLNPCTTTAPRHMPLHSNAHHWTRTIRNAPRSCAAAPLPRMPPRPWPTQPSILTALLRHMLLQQHTQLNKNHTQHTAFTRCCTIASKAAPWPTQPSTQTALPPPRHMPIHSNAHH